MRAGPGLIERWIGFADRRRRAILAVCAILALVGGVGTVRLYADLRPDLAELLPARSQSAVDLARVTERVGGYAEETVILYGADALTLQLFADDLADELDKAPPGLIRSVEYRVDELRDFFLPRLLLFLPQHDLVHLRDTLAARIAWEREAARPHRPVTAGAELPRRPAPDVEGLVRSMRTGRRDLWSRYPDGYVMGEVSGERPGEKLTVLAMVVRLAASSGDYAKVTALDGVLHRSIAALDPAKRAPGLKVAFGGYVASNIREHAALAEDLVWATVLVILAVALAVAVYNRTWKAVFAVGVPLVCGTLVTFGLAELVVGHLNSNTAFLGSIVVGNGINVGLILFARYLEERRRGAAPLPAMQLAVAQTWLATLTAALAAGVSYASLLATDFRGFNQFGLIGGTGMALAWLFAYGMTPPLVLAWERRAPIPRAGQRPARPLFTQLVSSIVTGWPRLTVAVGVLLSAVAVALVVRYAADPIEYDFRNLRDPSALREGGPGWWDDRVDALHGGHLSPTVLLARDADEARAVSAALEAHQRRTPGTRIGEIVSIAQLVPADQEAKLPVIRELRALATPENLAFLPPDKRIAVEKVLPAGGVRPFGPQDLPAQLRLALSEVDGRVGTPVLVYPSPELSQWNGREVLQFAEELRSVTLPRPDIPMASSMLVFADVLGAIRADGPRATLLSLAGVAALVLFAFGLGRRATGGPGLRRALADAGWVLASLAVGVVWFGGLAGALGTRLNMLNFIALPITFGIGVDYATNVFQRRRVDDARSIGSVIRTTGGAVALCSLTTIIGYASLLVARNQALFSFGLLAVMGEVACLAAALFALPAVLRWRERALEGRPTAQAEPAARP
jgi:predicted RND superfamily exporter protein